MKWWYANEESDLKERAGKWIDYINCEVIKEVVETIKESKMEFDKSRVYTALNADELRVGDKVIVADTIHCLEVQVKGDVAADTICQVNPPTWGKRFSVGAGNISASLAYLVERAENCTNCGKFQTGYCCDGWDVDAQKIFRCDKYKPKTEPKAEKHYRPFRDIDELIKVWDAKCPNKRPAMTMPLIWVRHKQIGSKSLITDYVDDYTVIVGTEGNGLQALFDDYTFLDGSVCGVEE